MYMYIYKYIYIFQNKSIINLQFYFVIYILLNSSILVLWLFCVRCYSEVNVMMFELEIL